MNCDKCQHKMIEVPLFTGFRFECKNCEEMELLKTAFEDYILPAEKWNGSFIISQLNIYGQNEITTHDLGRWFGDGGHSKGAFEMACDEAAKASVQPTLDLIQADIDNYDDDNKGNK